MNKANNIKIVGTKQYDTFIFLKIIIRKVIRLYTIGK